MIEPFAYKLIMLNRQMGAVETNFEEVTNIFDTSSAKGLTGDSLEKIPKIKITSNNNIDASGEKVSCSVCLQVRSFSPHLSAFNPVTRKELTLRLALSNCLCFVFRTFSLERPLEACRIAITCFTYLA